MRASRYRNRAITVRFAALLPRAPDTVRCVTTRQRERFAHSPMTADEIDQSIRAAIDHHQAGRLQKAEQLYRQVLAISPDNPDALHFLGMLAHQAGRSDTAVELMRRSIAVNNGVA